MEPNHRYNRGEELGLAISRTWIDENAQRQEETTFIDVTLWGRMAQIEQQYLREGSPVFIEGRRNRVSRRGLLSRSWELS